MRRRIEPMQWEQGNCIAVLDSEGTLTISPKEGTDGLLFNRDPFHPDIWWWVRNEDIRKVVIKKGVKAKNSINGLFRGLRSCHKFDVGNLDTSSVVSMRSVFSECFFLTDIKGLKNWDIGNVEDMRYMFERCCSLENFSPIKDWHTGKVKKMNGMFFGCSSLRDPSPFFGWNVTNAERRMMFLHCPCEDPFAGLPEREETSIKDTKKKDDLKTAMQKNRPWYLRVLERFFN